MELNKLIAEHKLLKTETWEQLQALNGLDISKFSEKECRELQQSINELQVEYSMRQCFLGDLESLL